MGRKIYIFRGPLVLLALFGMCFPNAVLATMTQGNQVVDIALMDGGVLMGQVVDGKGVSQVGVPVSLHYQNEMVATPSTNQGGYFALKGVKAGVYRILVGKEQRVYRFWAPGTAPPTANRGVMIVTDTEVTRAQSSPQPLPPSSPQTVPPSSVQAAQPPCPQMVEPPCPPPVQPPCPPPAPTFPWVIAGVVATAIAVPVAIHNSNGSDPASP